MSDYREVWEGAISVCRERNDEITRLRAEVADLTKANGLLHAIVSNREEEISGLRAQLAIAGEHIAEMMDRLASARKALEPFAAIDFPEVYSDRLPILGIDRLIGGLTLEHLRAAKSALTDEKST